MKQAQYIAPSTVHGKLNAPSSKSDMQRAVAAAYLTGGTCEITHPSLCADSLVALDIVKTLGAIPDIRPDRIIFTPGQQAAHLALDCGESGFSLRMFSAIASLLDTEVILQAQGGLRSRPISMIEAPLTKLGVACHTQNGLPPVTVKGPIQAGTVTVDASITSQFLTGLLMTLPMCAGRSEIRVPTLKSKPYVLLTLGLLEKFGIDIENHAGERFIIEGPQHYDTTTYTVEGDWSGAAFLLVAGAIAGNVRVENLNFASYQADRAILEVLKMAGVGITLGTYFVEIQQRSLKAFEFDAVDCPDLFPPLVALAVCCEGTSVIHGTHRLTHKECDRGKALLHEFRKMGISIQLVDDRMEVTGGTLQGGDVDSYNDHRIAMACAIAGLRSQHGVTINNWECVAKSYPQFFDDLHTLTATD